MSARDIRTHDDLLALPIVSGSTIRSHQPPVTRDFGFLSVPVRRRLHHPRDERHHGRPEGLLPDLGGLDALRREVRPLLRLAGARARRPGRGLHLVRHERRRQHHDRRRAPAQDDDHPDGQVHLPEPDHHELPADRDRRLGLQAPPPRRPARGRGDRPARNERAAADRRRRVLRRGGARRTSPNAGTARSTTPTARPRGPCAASAPRRTGSTSPRTWSTWTSTTRRCGRSSRTGPRAGSSSPTSSRSGARSGMVLLNYDSEDITSVVSRETVRLRPDPPPDPSPRPRERPGRDRHGPARPDRDRAGRLRAREHGRPDRRVRGLPLRRGRRGRGPPDRARVLGPRRLRPQGDPGADARDPRRAQPDARRRCRPAASSGCSSPSRARAGSSSTRSRGGRSGSSTGGNPDLGTGPKPFPVGARKRTPHEERMGTAGCRRGGWST